MKSPILLLLALLSVAGSQAQAEDSEASKLAAAVIKAAGGDAWPRVTRVKFTFNVDADGKRKTSVQHDWDVRAGTDTVTWQGKTATANVFTGETSGDAMGAYKRWVNDTYWLLAPLKLADKGVHLQYGGEKEMQGAKYETLELSFDKVGLTSGDRYRLYVDPGTHLVRLWDFMPNPETTKTATWEDYKESGGLTLSTRHRMGNVLITITGLEVSAD